MALFEISNPSDPYTIKSDDWRVTCAATLLLGGGAYGLTEYRGKRGMPVFLLGGCDAWFKSEFNCDAEEFIKTTSLESIIAALDSVLIGSPSSRLEFDLALDAIDNPEKKRAVLAARHDRKRSSMNNIGASAERLANKLRETLKKDMAADLY